MSSDRREAFFIATLCVWLAIASASFFGANVPGAVYYIFIGWIMVLIVDSLLEIRLRLQRIRGRVQ